MNKITALYRYRDSDVGCNPIGSSFILKMKRKTLFYSLFLPILLLTLSSVEIRAEGQEGVRVSEQSDLRLAAWNIRIMSNKSRNDAELIEIARTLADYDFIAIVELRDEMVLKRTQKILSQMGKMYDYEFSPAVGRVSKERYAFLYRSKLVSVVRHGELYPDAADGKDDFIRDPYWATFRAGEFDFSVIAVHVIWGNRSGPRKAEVKALADVYRHVQEANGTEEDVLLVGDFNRNPNDAESYSRIMAIPSMTRLFELPQKSRIGDTSLYDNIYFQTDAVTEYLGRCGIDRFDETDFGNDDKAANLAVSDHRPVWAVFGITRDDDGSDDGGSASVLVQGSKSTEPDPPEDVTVYVTRTGKKYHRYGCSSLRRSKIPISLAEARQRNYGPCSRCNPPR